MTEAPAKNGNGWALKALYAVAFGYFGWVGITLVDIGREVSAMKSNVDRLVVVRDAESTQKSTHNSDRLDVIEENAQ